MKKPMQNLFVFFGCGAAVIAGMGTGSRDRGFLFKSGGVLSADNA